MKSSIWCRRLFLLAIATVATAAWAVERSVPAGYAFRMAENVELGSPGLVAENSVQGFRARLTQEGIRVDPLEGDWDLGLNLVGIGRGVDLEPVEPTGAMIDDHRAEFRRGVLAEWCSNDERGIEQGFTLGQRPRGDRGGKLILQLALITSYHHDTNGGVRAAHCSNEFCVPYSRQR